MEVWEFENHCIGEYSIYGHTHAVINVSRAQGCRHLLLAVEADFFVRAVTLHTAMKAELTTSKVFSIEKSDRPSKG